MASAAAGAPPPPPSGPPGDPRKPPPDKPVVPTLYCVRSMQHVLDPVLDAKPSGGMYSRCYRCRGGTSSGGAVGLEH
jgi:hypothetical protein